MTHYICEGTCGTVMDEPGVCEAPDCPRQYQKLSECYCEDGMHNGKVKPQIDPYKA